MSVLPDDYEDELYRMTELEGPVVAGAGVCVRCDYHGVAAAPVRALLAERRNLTVDLADCPSCRAPRAVRAILPRER